MSSELPKVVKIERSSQYKRAKEAELKNPYFKFHYINPKDVSIKTANCAIRAIAKAEDISYDEACIKLYKHLGKIGMSYYCYFPQDYLTTNYVKETFKAVKGEPRMNGKTFAESHPKGRYVLNMAHHLAACVDGIIYDNFDSSYLCVYGCWRVV